MRHPDQGARRVEQIHEEEREHDGDESDLQCSS